MWPTMCSTWEDKTCFLDLCLSMLNVNPVCLEVQQLQASTVTSIASFTKMASSKVASDNTSTPSMKPFHPPPNLWECKLRIYGWRVFCFQTHEESVKLWKKQNAQYIIKTGLKVSWQDKGIIWSFKSHEAGGHLDAFNFNLIKNWLIDWF